MITAVLLLSLLQSSPNTLTPAERTAGWQLLFDGRTLAVWRGVGYDTVPTANWVVVNGAIKKIASGDVPRVADGRPLVGGDLMTRDSFADFELTFEWKVTPGANSGVKYNVSEAMSIAQGGAGTQGGPSHSALGFEYQVLDDVRHEDGKLPSHRSAALYDLIAPNEQMVGAQHAAPLLHPVGEWNRSGIVFRGNHDEHWLNGPEVVDVELGSARIDSPLAASKVKSIPDFRRAVDDKSSDALVIAPPDHCHAPAAILAMSAGKHVYLEKPCGHNAREGELLVEAQRKHARVVQMGTQQRSAPRAIEVVQAIRDGLIGKPYLPRAWYANTRATIGRGKSAPVPANLNYDLWQGPAPHSPYHDNVIHYNWHWFRRWGPGEIAKNGTHEIDVCRWALGVDRCTRVTSTGGRHHFDDDWEFTDTQEAVFEFPGEKRII